MAHSLSARKRIRQNQKRRLRNRSQRSRLRTQMKKLRGAIDAADPAEAKRLLPETTSLIDRMVKKGVIHHNAGDRYKSRLAMRIARLGAEQAD